MGYLIDTCVFSEFTRPRPAESVERWLESVPERDQFVSVLTLGELEKGIRKLEPGRRRTSFESWFGALRARFAERVLSIDARVALEWGRIAATAEAKGKSLPVVDSLIAATALVHCLRVVTRNGSDMTRTGVEIVNPWA